VLDKVNINASNGILHELSKVMLPPVGNMVEALSKCPVFKTLTSLIRDAGLVSTLSGRNLYIFNVIFGSLNIYIYLYIHTFFKVDHVCVHCMSLIKVFVLVTAAH